MPWLPPQLLVIQQAHDLVLVGVEGHVYGRLMGFALAPFTRSNTLQALAAGLFLGALPSKTLLLGPKGRAWWLVGGRLVALSFGRLQLPGGAELVALPEDRNGNVQVLLRDTRGRGLLATNWVISGSLMITPQLVFDLITRSRWVLGPGMSWLTIDGLTGSPGTCTPAGVTGEKLIAACVTYAHPRARNVNRALELDVRLYSVAANSHREPVARPIILKNASGIHTAFLSPDRKYVAGDLDIECGRQATVTQIPAGTPRYLDLWNSARQFTQLNIQAHQATTVLGWSEHGSVIVQVQHIAECGPSIRPGIYLINPKTLRRRLVYAYVAGDATKPVGAALSGPN